MDKDLNPMKEMNLRDVFKGFSWNEPGKYISSCLDQVQAQDSFMFRIMRVTLVSQYMSIGWPQHKASWLGTTFTTKMQISEKMLSEDFFSPTWNIGKSHWSSVGFSKYQTTWLNCPWKVSLVYLTVVLTSPQERTFLFRMQSRWVMVERWLLAVPRLNPQYQQC